jgi:hypothetical protein
MPTSCVPDERKRPGVTGEVEKFDLPRWTRPEAELV